jgi:hypothetical protein
MIINSSNLAGRRSKNRTLLLNVRSRSIHAVAAENTALATSFPVTAPWSLIKALASKLNSLPDVKE